MKDYIDTKVLLTVLLGMIIYQIIEPTVTEMTGKLRGSNFEEDYI